MSYRTWKNQKKKKKELGETTWFVIWILYLHWLAFCSAKMLYLYYIQLWMLSATIMADQQDMTTNTTVTLNVIGWLIQSLSKILFFIAVIFFSITFLILTMLFLPYTINIKLFYYHRVKCGICIYSYYIVYGFLYSQSNFLYTFLKVNSY